jgi:hypothetical protein
MRRWLSDENNQDILLRALAFGVPCILVLRFFKDEHLLVRLLLTSYGVVTLTLASQYLAKKMRIATDQTCPSDVPK